MSIHTPYIKWAVTHSSASPYTTLFHYNFNSRESGLYHTKRRRGRKTSGGEEREKRSEVVSVFFLSPLLQVDYENNVMHRVERRSEQNRTNTWRVDIEEQRVKRNNEGKTKGERRQKMPWAIEPKRREIWEENYEESKCRELILIAAGVLGTLASFFRLWGNFHSSFTSTTMVLWEKI